MKILLATEGGERGEANIRFLSPVIKAGGHHVDLVYVKEVEEEMEPKHYDIVKETQEKKGVAEAGASRKPVLSEMAEVARVSGFEVDQVGLKGDPAEVILERADQGYDLIAMGGGGRGIFTKEMLGIVANRIVKECPVSVMINKGEAESLDRILLCTRGDDKARVVFEFLAEFLGGGGFDVTALHVTQSFSRLKGYMESVQDDIEEVANQFKPEKGSFLEEGIELLGREGIEAEPRVREGDFDEEVLAEAKEGNYDLVVLGSHILSEWFEEHGKGDETVPLVRDLDQSFLLVRDWVV